MFKCVDDGEELAIPDRVVSFSLSVLRLFLHFPSHMPITDDPIQIPFRVPYFVGHITFPSICHASLRHHLPTWLFLILISDSDSLCLPPYLRYLV